MDIRPARSGDLAAVREIDATIESAAYLHVDQSGEGPAMQWRLSERALREKRVDANPVTDDLAFTAAALVNGVEDGVALWADHDGQPAALLLAQHRHDVGTVQLIDLRVDYDFRRQGLATVLLYRLIETLKADEKIDEAAGVRAIYAEITSNNAPAAALLAKLNFQLSGIDTRRRSNHDLVKESATLLWYFELTP